MGYVVIARTFASLTYVFMRLFRKRSRFSDLSKRHQTPENGCFKMNNKFTLLRVWPGRTQLTPVNQDIEQESCSAHLLLE
jgi:hypothetical protein